MLRCNFELTAYMIFAKFIEKFIIVFVVNKIVKSYSGAYKHFFYTGYVAKLASVMIDFWLLAVTIRPW